MAKTTEITAEICKNREIHSKITTSTVKSEHVSKAPVVHIWHCFLYIYIAHRKYTTYG